MARDFRNLIVSAIARRTQALPRARNQEKQVVVNLEVSSAPVKLRRRVYVAAALQRASAESGL